MSKVCTHCKVDKPFSMFKEFKHSAQGYSTTKHCLQCLKTIRENQLNRDLNIRYKRGNIHTIREKLRERIDQIDSVHMNERQYIESLLEDVLFTEI